MTFSRVVLLVISIALLLAAPFWSSGVAGNFTKLPANYGFDLNLEHTENNRFSFDQDWSGNVVTLSNIKNTTQKATESTLVIDSSFKVKSITGETLFDNEQRYLVDRYTNHDLPGFVDPAGDSYYMFPKHTETKTYRFWPGTFGKPFDMKFIKSDTISGMKVFHFQGQDNALDDTQGYSFLPLVPEKYRALSKATIDVYVEPTSGMIVNYKDRGVSYYSDNEGHRLWDIAQWSNELKPDSIKTMAGTAKKTKDTIFLHEIFIPFIYFGSGAFLLYKFVRSGKKK